MRLVLDDYEVFRAVQSTEYIEEVFGLSAATTDGYALGHANLDRFTHLVNCEAHWVPTEVCNESNTARRVDLLKRFIKVSPSRCRTDCYDSRRSAISLGETLLMLYYAWNSMGVPSA